MDEDDLKSSLRHYLTNCIGVSSSSQSSDVSDAILYYDGAPFSQTWRRTGPIEQDRRSKVVSRVVMETVEWQKPAIIRMFKRRNPVVEFTGGESASAETKAVSAAFWRYAGSQILRDSVHDTLLLGNCIAKIVEETRTHLEVREVSVSSMQDLAILSTQGWEVTSFDDASMTATVRREVRKTGIDVSEVPVDRFRIYAAHDRLSVEDAMFCAELILISRSDLLSYGLSEDDLAHVRWEDTVGTTSSERARRERQDSSSVDLRGTDTSTWMTWVLDGSALLDMDGDGQAERWRVILATDEDGQDLYDILVMEPQSTNPYVCGSCLPMPHRWLGQSTFDRTWDLQDTASAVTRGIIDNVFYLNSAEGIYDINRFPDPDTFGESFPQKHHACDGNPGNAYMPMAKQAAPAQAFQLLDELDSSRKGRTGVGDDVMGLNPEILRSINTGVMQTAMSQSQQILIMMAGNYADTFVMPICLKIHEILRTSKELGREYGANNWPPRTEASTLVGLSVQSTMERAAALEAVINRQADIMNSPAGETMLSPQNIHTAIQEWIDALGLDDAGKYFMDPSQVPPPQPQPDPQMVIAQQQLQAQLAEIQRRAANDRDKMMIERARMNLDAAIAADKASREEAANALSALTAKYSAEIKAGSPVASHTEQELTDEIDEAGSAGEPGTNASAGESGTPGDDRERPAD